MLSLVKVKDLTSTIDISINRAHACIMKRMIYLYLIEVTTYTNYVNEGAKDRCARQMKDFIETCLPTSMKKMTSVLSLV